MNTKFLWFLVVTIVCILAGVFITEARSSETYTIMQKETLLNQGDSFILASVSPTAEDISVRVELTSSVGPFFLTNTESGMEVPSVLEGDKYLASINLVPGSYKLLRGDSVVLSFQTTSVVDLTVNFTGGTLVNHNIVMYVLLVLLWFCCILPLLDL